jgi:ATP-dependent Clp protease protease subunit
MSDLFMPRVTANIDGLDQNTDLVSLAFISQRRIYICSEITNQTALAVTTQLMYLDDRGQDDITLVINSPGGSVTAGFAIYDMIKSGITSDVVTVAVGMAASMGAFLLAAGSKGKRFAAPNAQIMLHQPLGGVQGQATDISLVAEHIQQVKRRLAEILAENCGKPVKTLLKDTERDHWLSPLQAKEYGLIDHIGFPNPPLEVSLHE